MTKLMTQYDCFYIKSNVQVVCDFGQNKIAAMTTDPMAIDMRARTDSSHSDMSLVSSQGHSLSPPLSPVLIAPDSPPPPIRKPFLERLANGDFKKFEDFLSAKIASEIEKGLPVDQIAEKIFEIRTESLVLINQLAEKLGNAKGCLEKLFEVVEKMLDICLEALPYYRDKLKIGEHFPFINDVLNTETVLNFMVKAIKRMLSGEGAFSDAKELLKTYNNLCAALKGSLFVEDEPAFVSWKSRSSFLFLFCRILIEETMHPYLRQFVSLKLEYQELIDIILDVCSKFVLAIVIADDIADNIQDPDLLKFFMDFARKDINEILQAPLTLEGEPKYAKYSDLYGMYVKLWQDNIKQLQKVFGNDGNGEDIFTSCWRDISSSWILVMNCLAKSVEINTVETSDTYGGVTASKQTDELLANNMLMTFFATLQESFLKKLNPDFGSDPQFHDDLWSILRGGEVIGHGGNHAATYAKEADQNDLTNTTFVTTGLVINALLKKKGFTFFAYVNANFAELFSQADIKKEENFYKLLFSLSSLKKDVFKKLIQIRDTLSCDEKVGSSVLNKLKEDLSQCTDDKRNDMVKIVRDLVASEPRLADLPVIKEFYDLVAKRDARVKLVVKLIESPETGGIPYYLKHNLQRVVNKDIVPNVDSIKSLDPTIGPFLDEYVGGVKNLVALYILCKSIV